MDKKALDRHITGNYGEDQLRSENTGIIAEDVKTQTGGYNMARKATKHIQLRCPMWLYRIIKETADKERRSVTNLILLIVERYFLDKKEGDTGVQTKEEKEV